MDQRYIAQSHGTYFYSGFVWYILFFNAGISFAMYNSADLQFVVFIELVGSCVLPAAIAFTLYIIVISIVRRPVPIIPLCLFALILGLPAVLIVFTAKRWSYLGWMLIYLLSLPIWNFVLPVYAFWNFDNFSW